MRIKPSLGLVVGPVNANHWSQVLSMPGAYGIVEISDPEGHAQEVGVRTLSQLGEGLQNAVLSLKELEKICDSVDEKHLQTLIVLVPIENIVYIVVRGKGIVYVKRGSELASLMHKDGGLSGEVKIHDTILLASDGFSGVLTREELSNLFDHLPPIEIAEKLTLLLHEKTGGEGSVAMVFGVSEFTDVDKSTDLANESEPDDKKSVDALPTPSGEQSHKAVEKSRGNFFQLSVIKDLAKRVRTHPRLLKASIAIFFIILFILSVILGVKKQSTVKTNQRIESVRIKAQSALDEGIALLALNPSKGRDRLEEAKELLTPLQETVSSRTVEGRKIIELYEKVVDNLTQALQITFVEPALYYDVSLVKKNSIIHAISRNGNELVMGDTTSNTVFRMDFESKNARIIAGGADMKGSMLTAIHGNKTYVFTDAGIMEVSPDTKKPTVIIKKDEEWGTISSLISFGGNLYLLDVVKSRIWKYVATEKGFTERREYLNPDTLPDLTRVSGMSIDSSVFLGNEDGSILRFTQGRENSYVPKGVDPAFGTSPIVYASDDAKHLYVLDPKLSRIVALDKEGMYISQYQYKGASPKQFLVFEKLKKIVLLQDGKLYTIDLR